MIAARVQDPKGRVRRIYFRPNDNGCYAAAWVHIGLFKRITNYAAHHETAIDNLIRRLKKKGWKVITERRQNH